MSSEKASLTQSVKDLLTQRGPSAESVTRPVEAFSQGVSSSPPFLCRCSVKHMRLCNSFIPNKCDSHTGDTERNRKLFLLMQETKHK